MSKNSQNKWVCLLLAFLLAVIAAFSPYERELPETNVPSEDSLSYPDFYDEYRRLLNAIEENPEHHYPRMFKNRDRRVIYNDALDGHVFESTENSKTPVLLGVLSPGYRSIYVIFHGDPAIKIVSNSELQELYPQMSRSAIQHLNEQIRE